MISMHNIEDTTSLNRISSDEDEYLESPLNIQKVQEIEQQSLQQCDEEVPISETPIERSFNRHIDERINDTAVLQNHANEITQKIMKNVKCAFQREIIKELVSKSKKRFKLDGFNLDLTYVTDSLIAMGFPAENFEAIYRNSMSEVQKFLNTRHPSNYMVINLCSERKYKHESFFKVAEFPFDDHQAPPFTLIVDFCTAVHDWLTQDPNHVIAVHCKAGKGRTGVMICCYLLYSGKYTSSQDALAYYGLVRTLNQKGVTIPSQIRYVHYFSFALKNDLIKRPFLQVELLSVRLVGSAHGSLIRLQNNSKQLIEKAQIISEKEIIFTFDGIYLQGDVLLQIFQKSIVSESKILQIWFNTNFVSLSPNEQVFKASEIDIMKKSKKKHSSNMQLELLLNKTVEIRQRSNCFSKGI
ncbi:unnamed protein product (macronuclear) [Paramecium tetraurelia]|uniref:Uncharacterized protein n=1 Tax=Paramecium tetraurelia TaxID=5888 RepID=A0EF81_PARTE|nr:uncharacterized protein GSPATT00026295001 [Paramecium tetraurelia]CAK93972.1 unnamed protein product [Paramecium tetraurelia]|eukprot:XP_001461345.1 hypothetical protein (macronuclear) [Paramecium tetraurelia strain d4-2]